jgi:hypothetical protein
MNKMLTKTRLKQKTGIDIVRNLNNNRDILLQT